MIFKLKRKVEKGERNDEMTCESKSKALLTINLNAQHVNEMTLLICTVIRNHTVMTLYLNFPWFVDQNDKMERQIQARRPFPQPYD